MATSKKEVPETPAPVIPQKIQVRIQQQPEPPEAEPKEYWIEDVKGKGEPFKVNAKTYNKTFKNNPAFKISTQSSELKKK